jgi:hypothetical protein
MYMHGKANKLFGRMKLKVQEAKGVLDMAAL